MGTVKLCQPSTDSLKPKTAGHVTFCHLSHRGPRSNSSQAWRPQSTVISRVITFIHDSLSRIWYIPRQYINLQDAYEMCFGNIKHSNMTPGKLFEQTGDLLNLRGLKWSKNTGKCDNTTKVSSKTKIIMLLHHFGHK